MTEVGLVKYDAICSAIADCHRVDEVKDLRDKARALEGARPVLNPPLERTAVRTGDAALGHDSIGTESGGRN